MKEVYTWYFYILFLHLFRTSKPSVTREIEQWDLDTWYNKITLKIMKLHQHLHSHFGSQKKIETAALALLCDLFYMSDGTTLYSYWNKFNVDLLKLTSQNVLIIYEFTCGIQMFKPQYFGLLNMTNVYIAYSWSQIFVTLTEGCIHRANPDDVKTWNSQLADLPITFNLICSLVMWLAVTYKYINAFTVADGSQLVNIVNSWSYLICCCLSQKQYSCVYINNVHMCHQLLFLQQKDDTLLSVLILSEYIQQALVSFSTWMKSEECQAVQWQLIEDIWIKNTPFWIILSLLGLLFISWLQTPKLSTFNMTKADHLLTFAAFLKNFVINNASLRHMM